MVTSRQLTVSSTRRDAWVEVDLGAIEYNVKKILSWLESGTPDTSVDADTQRSHIQSNSPGEKAGMDLAVTQRRSRPALMAVVKSDAYGHGALGVAEVLIGSGAQWLGVASVDEGCQLRTIDQTVPILILSPAPRWGIQTALDHNLDLTVTSASQIGEIAAIAARKNGIARVHLKVDTGMHRLGVEPESIDTILDELQKNNQLRLISVLSHLAKADEFDATDYQNRQFTRVVESVRQRESELRESGVVSGSLLFHLASSDATRRFPATHYDMARVGLALYGLEPVTPSAEIIPAMSVKARINQVKTVAPGESVGYGWTWTAERETRLASVPIGYADGVDRGLSNRLHGLLMGKEIAQVGRISMDQMLFDITDIAGAQEGDVITLIGTDGAKSIDLASWAGMLDTITYELACRLRVRLPRIYTRHRHEPTG